MSSSGRPSPVAGQFLDRWVQAGLLSADQAGRIAEWERATEPSSWVAPQAVRTTGSGVGDAPSRRAAGVSPVIEALAYLGGAVILAALGIAVGSYWSTWSFSTHLAIPGTATAILVAAGAIVPMRGGPVGVRLRAALWVAAAAALLMLLTVATGHAVDLGRMSGDRALLLVSGGLFVVAAALWLVHRTGPQQSATFVAVVMCAIAVVSQGEQVVAGAAGLAIAVVAVLWGVLSWLGVLPGGGRWLGASGGLAVAGQRRWGMAVAAFGADVGAITVASVPPWDQSWLGTLPVAVALLGAMALADLVMLLMAAVGTLIVLPIVAEHYFESTLVVAVVLLLTGAMMVLLAVAVARRRKRPRRADPDSAYSR